MEKQKSADRPCKSPLESAVETRFLLMPRQANPYGTAFGGAIVAEIDMTASMAAQRHCEGFVVTAGIDSIHFEQPLYIGDQIVLQACVNYAGRTSMEVGVRVEAENPLTGAVRHTASAYLTFVALGDDGMPTEVPPITPETAEDKRRNAQARARRSVRLAERTREKSCQQNPDECVME